MIPYLALPPGASVLIIDPESRYFERLGIVAYFEGDIIFVNFDDGLESSEETSEFTVYQLTPIM